MKYILRALQPSDHDAVARLHRRFTHEIEMTEFLSAANVDRDPESPPLAYVAAAPDGQILGYVIGAVRAWEFGSPPAGWILGIAIDPQHKGSGIATSLLSALCVAFAKRQTRTVRTMVRRDDIDVLRFFRSAGFSAGPYVELELEIPS